MFRLPPAGSTWGAGKTGQMADGLFQMLQDTWKQDSPHRLRNISNYQWGLRVRGFTKGVDWTLQYFDAIDFLPVGIPNRVNQQVSAYFLLNGNVDESVRSRVWQYKRTRYLGATAQYFEELFIQGVVSFELSYQIGKHYNTTNIDGDTITIPAFKYKGKTYGPFESDLKSLSTGDVQKDGIGYGLSIDRPIMWPWLAQYNENRVIDFSVQVFQDWILGHQRNLALQPGRGAGDRSTTAFTALFMTHWYHDEFLVVYKTLYDTSGTGYNIAAVNYAPGRHWRYEIGCMFFYSLVNHAQEPNSFDKDSLYFRLKYEW